MSLLPFGELPPHTQRQFVPAKVEFWKWETIEPLFNRLEAAAADCRK